MTKVKCHGCWNLMTITDDNRNIYGHKCDVTNELISDQEEEKECDHYKSGEDGCAECTKKDCPKSYGHLH
ncbi:MAG: hypothetical protein ACYTBZ_29200 [Planctomycetota bacterium]|jgi:hypothetical protein